MHEIISFRTAIILLSKEPDAVVHVQMKGTEAQVRAIFAELRIIVDAKKDETTQATLPDNTVYEVRKRKA